MAEIVLTEPPSTLHESSDLVASERVRMRLFEVTPGVFTLERELTRRDGVALTQVIDVPNTATLHDFATADPYGLQLAHSYRTIQRKFETALREISFERVSATGLDAEQAIGELENCRTEGELLLSVRNVVTLLGGREFTYNWLRFTEPEPDRADLADARFLVGCRASWIQQYVAKLWYVSDPFIHYARTHVAPTRSSAISLHRQDHWLLTEARGHGLYNGLVIPAHVRGNELVGLLFVTAATPDGEGEDKLWERRQLFRALSAELLDWHIAHVRREALEQFRLDDQEATVLQMRRWGDSARDIADRIGVSESVAYKIFQRINEKMGVNRISDAVAKAATSGMID
ncbi:MULTISPECIES: autoinducer binding domain-containing protein [Paraburkholderia]|uniref:Autoinducer binding domain-containing protein n=1 Tax=Paraburkholderia madseniana TaxID=2599607 RepID=A0AAP5EZX0_9BURK|nr:MULTISPECIES: autoinducer binding domain-containing protein [Paraburkholderia]MCX4150029.1 autoinducer binding domain-containing protein [Paraburkholderia madseniana]MCX4175680.1 autoinducer binding domain-containing protein [Paraburkholderia madseniana]MDN7152965.1 autoinducer binding domain-containing protein [Paraburkholderia sp. WS6]MDQ6411847.1 autoinducer binding domain-containing protein [Paraburkholderia madseniana]MDQ6463675.1 autoinducer binding domain-containing protein [Paraburk